MAHLCLFGCQREPVSKQPVLSSDLAPGTLTVDVISPRAGGEAYWQYRITPSRGQVELFGSGRRPRSQWTDPHFLNAANCFQGEQKRSANGELVARCFHQEPGRRPEFTVTSTVGGPVFGWDPGEWRGVDGFGWCTNSRALAMVNYSEIHGAGLLDRIWSSAGHPVPYRTIYLDIIDANRGVSTEYMIRRDVEEGNARIVDWLE
jgi:hypothetical protein